MLPTVAEVLALDPVRSGAPRVLAAAERLDAPVRWVHVIELAQAAHLLRGGELVLSTGIALPEDGAGLERYVAELAAVGVSALAVELGSRYSRSLPSALVAAAGEHRLPLIVLERETQFIEITEAVHARIIDAQLSELRSAERLHQVFTDLAVSGASADEVVTQTASLAGCPVILESLAHHVLACAPGTQDAAALLAGFAGRSRAVQTTKRTGYDDASGWLVTVVGARGEDWGRLIMMRGGPPAPADVALIERAATTLALGRLLEHRQESLERQAHRTILSAFLGHGFADQAAAWSRSSSVWPVPRRPGTAGTGWPHRHVPPRSRTRSPRSAGASGCQPWSERSPTTGSQRSWRCQRARTPRRRWRAWPSSSGRGCRRRTSSARARPSTRSAGFSARSWRLTMSPRPRPAPARRSRSTGCPISGSAGCCTSCATIRGCTPSPSASSGRCWSTTMRPARSY